MSKASTENLTQAAAILSATSVVLAANPNQMDPGTAADVLLTVAQGAAPFLHPNAALAISLGSIALGAVHAATQAKKGITHEELLALFDADDVAKAEDARVQAMVVARQV